MTTSIVVNWYSINIADDWKRHDAGTQRHVSAPGMEMNKNRIKKKRYNNNYDYINGSKELILDLICKCKGKLTTEAMVKSMSLEEVACLLGQEKEGNLTPHESISDLSIISDTNSTRSAMFHDEGRENQTPSPTLNGFGNSTRFDRRASFGSKKLFELGKTMKKSIVNGLTKNATFRNLHQAASMSSSQTTTGTFATPKSVPRSRNNTTSRMRSQSTQQVADDNQNLSEHVPRIQVHGAKPDAHTRRLNSASHDNGLTMMHNYTLSNLHNVQSSTTGRSMTNLREPSSRGKPTFQTLV